MTPHIIPIGLYFSSAAVGERRMGKMGRLHGESIVIRPAINEKSNKIIIHDPFYICLNNTVIKDIRSLQFF